MRHKSRAFDAKRSGVRPQNRHLRGLTPTEGARLRAELARSAVAELVQRGRRRCRSGGRSRAAPSRGSPRQLGRVVPEVGDQRHAVEVDPGRLDRLAAVAVGQRDAVVDAVDVGLGRVLVLEQRAITLASASRPTAAARCSAGNAICSNSAGVTARSLPVYSNQLRGVAQSGSAPGWGPGGRRFKSSHPDSASPLTMRARGVLATIKGHCPRTPSAPSEPARRSELTPAVRDGPHGGGHTVSPNTQRMLPLLATATTPATPIVNLSTDDSAPGAPPPEPNLSESRCALGSSIALQLALRSCANHRDRRPEISSITQSVGGMTRSCQAGSRWPAEHRTCADTGRDCRRNPDTRAAKRRVSGRPRNAVARVASAAARRARSSPGRPTT